MLSKDNAYIFYSPSLFWTTSSINCLVFLLQDEEEEIKLEINVLKKVSILIQLIFYLKYLNTVSHF